MQIHILSKDHNLARSPSESKTSDLSRHAQARSQTHAHSLQPAPAGEIEHDKRRLDDAPYIPGSRSSTRASTGDSSWCVRYTSRTILVFFSRFPFSSFLFFLFFLRSQLK